MQVSILRRRVHVTSPVLVVKLAEHRTQHQRHARWRQTKLQPDRGQRRSATASRMRPIFLHQVPSQPLSSFSTKKTRSSTARSKASAGAANAGGAKGPDFPCAFEDGEVRVIGENLTAPDKIRNLQRKTVIYTENGKVGMGGSLLRFSPLDSPPQPCCPRVAKIGSRLLSHSKLRWCSRRGMYVRRKCSKSIEPRCRIPPGGQAIALSNADITCNSMVWRCCAPCKVPAVVRFDFTVN
jgi:hypothetical protein